MWRILNWEKRLGEIQRLNQRQVFLIAGNVNKGASLGDALKQVDAVVSEIKLPPGVRVIPSSAAETNRELQSSLIDFGLGWRRFWYLW